VIDTPESKERVFASRKAVPFRCDVVYAGDHAVVAARGELDLATAPAVLREIRASLALPISGVTIDLGYVTFVDSSGVQALVTARNNAIEHGIGFRLDSVPRQARRVLETCHLLDLFGLPPRPDRAPPITAA
jgi:anti-sigma B factor antagonist